MIAQQLRIHFCVFIVIQLLAVGTVRAETPPPDQMTTERAELKLLRRQIESKDREIAALKSRVKELETNPSANESQPEVASGIPKVSAAIPTPVSGKQSERLHEVVQHLHDVEVSYAAKIDADPEYRAIQAEKSAKEAEISELVPNSPDRAKMAGQLLAIRNRATTRAKQITGDMTELKDARSALQTYLKSIAPDPSATVAMNRPPTTDVPMAEDPVLAGLGAIDRMAHNGKSTMKVPLVPAGKLKIGMQFQQALKINAYPGTARQIMAGEGGIEAYQWLCVDGTMVAIFRDGSLIQFQIAN